MSAKITLLVIALSVSLVGCGVRVEVVPPILPTPTPRIFPDIDSSLGELYRAQAFPRVTFGGSYQAELFMEPQSEAILFAYRSMWLDVPYEVTWFGSQRSNVQIGITAYTRPDPQATWERWDSAQHLLTTAQTPANQRDAIGINFYFEEARWLQARIEVSITAYLENGEVVNQVDVNEFDVRVVSDPGDIPSEDERLNPAFGDLEGLLLDWRGWSGAVCTNGFDEACGALDDGDIDRASQLLLNAIDEADPYVRPQIEADLGLIWAELGDYVGAAGVLQAAAEHYLDIDQPWPASIALHNLATVLSMNGDDQSYTAFTRLEEMRGQFYDEPGTALTEANIGYLAGERWRVESVLGYFEERSLPQQDVLSGWLDEMD